MGDIPLDLPNDNVTVAEDRYQAFAKAIFRVRPNLSFEAGLAFEHSALEQSGDANLIKHFDYLKPRLTATWSINSVTDVRLRVEKVVGQLDFYSFAASPNLEWGHSGRRQRRPGTGRINRIRTAIRTQVSGEGGRPS